MAEHTWIQEHLASYLAGGLEPDERERLEKHVASCASCSRALEETRHLDHMLDGVFTAVRPAPTLEDRIIQALRGERQPWPFWLLPLAAGMAALIMLGIAGSFTLQLMSQGGLPFLDGSLEARNRTSVTNNLKQLGLAIHSRIDAGEQSASAADISALDDALAARVKERFGQGRRNAAPGKHGKTITVYVAKEKMGRWTALKNLEAQFDQVDVPANEVDTNSVVTPETAKEALNRMLLRPLEKGDKLTRDALQSKDKGSLEVEVTPGKRAMAVRINQDSAVGGFVLPGSHVDVTHSTREGQHGPESKMVLQDVKVMAIDPQGKTATLEVTPQEALKLAAVKDSGSLALALRAYGDFRTVPEAESESRLGRAGNGRAGNLFDGEQAARERSMAEAKTTPSSSAPNQQLWYSYQDATPARPKPAEAWGSQGQYPAAKLGTAPADGINTQNRTLFGAHTAGPQLLIDNRVESFGKRTSAELAQQKTEIKTAEDQKERAQPARPEKTSPPEPATHLITRRIIRSGDIEFEIDSFDDATAAIMRLVGTIPGGFVSTINSEKLPNGKVRGSVVVRVPPEKLDALLLDLRKELTKHGELKGQRIGSQDITKQYNDLESRRRAARAMEERLLQIIKTGKGEIKDLIAAEKELGVWRTRIEEVEGELRYYANLVALSTLTITLTEKEIRAPVGLVEIERVQLGIEVEDVEKAQREALAAVADAKGQITKAELKQHGAGQYSALLHFSAAPDRAGPLRDRLKQLGTVARLDVDRSQQTEGGTGKPADGKVTRQDVQFIVSLYNVTGLAPRETVHLQVAAVDAEAGYRVVLAQVQKALGRIVSSDLNRPRNDQTKGVVLFEVKTTDADVLLDALKQVGEVISLQVTENADGQNVTRAKRGFNVQIWSLAAVAPRETTALQVAARDVPAGYRALQQAIAQAKGRVLNAQLNEQDRQNVTAQLDFEVRRSEETGVETALNALGDIHSRTVTRAPENETALDSKVRFQVKLVNAASLEPRETVALLVEVANVEQAAAAFSTYISEGQGRVVQSQVSHGRDGQGKARLLYDVPLAAAPALVEKLKTAGRVRSQQVNRNTQVPEGKLSVARLDILLTDAELIVPSDDGFWPQIRTGFQASFKAIAWSLTLVIIGVCVVLPWAVAIYVVYLVIVRLRRRAVTPT